MRHYRPDHFLAAWMSDQTFSGRKGISMALMPNGAKALRKVVKRDGLVVSLPLQLGVKDLGDQLAPQYGVAFAVTAVHPSGEQMAEMAKLANAGQLKTHLDAVFPLKDVAQAHKLSVGGHVRGKVVLTLD